MRRCKDERMLGEEKEEEGGRVEGGDEGEMRGLEDAGSGERGWR